MNEYVFNPTSEQITQSNIFKFMKKHDISSLEDLSRISTENLEWFWSQVDKDIGIVWDRPYEKVLDVSQGIMWPRWFVGGKTNIYTSSVEKFARSDPDKIAYYFESEDCTKTKLTYAELDKKVSKLANGLKKIGISKGDVVAIYLPMIEEAILAILASAKIGAMQTTIFSGYSYDSLKVRIEDCGAKVLFVCDGFYRKGKPISQKYTIERLINETNIEKVIIVSYGAIDQYAKSQRIAFYDDLIYEQKSFCKTETMDSDDPLFILYTSGTTGKPKGVVHVHGGFSVFAGHQSAYLVDTQKNDIVLWPADIGWITGLVWNVYGLLLIGASAVIYDGGIDFPNFNRIWDMLYDYNVSIFGISPTAVRMFKKNNVEPLSIHSEYKVKNIPTTGEPIDEDSWWWLFEKVGKRKIPIMNLSGGTEIGGAMLSVLPVTKLKPSTVGTPCPGMNLDVFDDNGDSTRQKNGYLVIKSPWPAMTKGLLNDSERYIETYWSRFKDVWFHGDYVYVDSDGLWYMQGRTDDVINVSGHRLSTAEIEHVAISHPKVSDAASISIPDDVTGEAIVVFFVPEKESEKGLDSEISRYISESIGKLARPKFVLPISELPKTRTGKIMRRLLKAKLLGNPIGDISSLENPNVLNEIIQIN